MSLAMSLSVQVKVTLTLSFGETVGDIPLYSLHRIKALLWDESPNLSRELHTALVGAIIRGNRKYREDSGRRWACLTSNNLAGALDEFDQGLARTISKVEAMPDDYPAIKRAVLNRLQAQRQATVDSVKRWFDERSERLLYDMRGKVPWSVVTRLRRDLGRWVAGAADPFKADIGDTVLEIARQEGIHVDTAEDAWKRMGGTIFTKGQEE